jgi:Tol biopolymer transport system component
VAFLGHSFSSYYEIKVSCYLIFTWIIVTSFQLPLVSAQGSIGQDDVWNPHGTEYADEIQQCHQQTSFVQCVVAVMQRAGASPGAIAITRQLDGRGFMISFEETGLVDLAAIFYPFNANNNWQLALVNGNPELIVVSRVVDTNIRSHPHYAALAEKHPNALLWAGINQYEMVEVTSTGGQRFIFSFALVDGCHACGMVGTARVAFEFDGSGRFLGSQLLSLVATDDENSLDAHPMGQIAFVSDRDGNREIYLVNADGTGLTNLTTHPAEDYYPAWSPDGRQLAFVSDRSGQAQVYIMNADGGEVQQISELERAPGRPVWSPDGGRIAFASSIFTPAEISLAIHWVNADGSELTTVYSGPGYGGRISWSPDGRQLVFDLNPGPDASFDLFVVNLDDGRLQKIADTVYTGGPATVAGKPSWEITPAWSPNGQWLAFGSNRFEGRLDVYIANHDGSGLRNLTPHVNYAFGPVWSPDSRRLAFMSAGEGIYVAEVGSTQLTRLSELSHLGTDADWSWSPDSRYLVFATGSGRNFNIYIVAHDGSEQTALISHPAHNADPVWRPVPPPPLVEGLIAYIGRDLNVWLITADGTEQRQVTHDASEDWQSGDLIRYENLQWSPNGQLLAFFRSMLNRDSLWLYDLSDASLRELVSERFLHGFTWSPDSSRIAYGPPVPFSHLDPAADPSEPTRGIWQVEVQTGVQSELVPPQQGIPLVRPRWSPDGRYLGSEETQIEGSGNFVVLDLLTGVYNTWNEPVGVFSWAPDGSNFVYDGIVYMDRGAGIWRSDPQGNTRARLTTVSAPTSDSIPRYSPTGDQIAFLRGIRFDSAGLWVMDADGANVRQLTEADTHHIVSWSPDGQRLVVSQGNYNEEGLFIVDLAGNVHFLADGRSPAWQPVFASAVPSGYSVSGQILDVYGFPLFGITVVLDEDRETETDEQGAFGFENVTAGAHSFQVEFTDGYRFEPAKREVELAGDLSHLDFTAIPVTDSGFRPDRNGYNFENRVLDRSWDMFEQYFGREQVTHPDGARCAVAEEFYQQEYRRAGRDFSCVGFSLTSLISYLEWPQPNAGSFAIDRFEALYDQPTSARLTDAIAYYSGTQRGQQWGDAYRSGLAKCTSDSGYIIEEIIAGIEGGSPPVLVLNSGLNNTWHVVTPYRVEKSTAAKADIFIYDNEAPGQERVVRFERLESGWRWTYTFVGTLAGAGTRIGNCSDLVLFSLAASTERGIPPINFCNVSEDAALPTQILVHIPADVDLSLENSDGQRLSWEDGSLISDIPGAYELLPGFGLQSLDSRTVLLPQDAYKFYLSAGRDGEAGVTLFSDGRFLSVARQVGESDSVLELATSQTLNQATLSSASHLGQVNVRFGLEWDHSRLVGLSAELPDQLHQIDLDFDGTSLSLSHDAREPADYLVSFGRGLDAVPISGTVRLEGSAMVRLQPTSWDNLETASIEWEVSGSSGMPENGSVEEMIGDDSAAQLLTLSQRLSQIFSLAWVRISGGLLAGIAIFGLGALTVRRYRRRAVKAVTGSNRFCVHCGAQYPPTGKFCIRCGQERV